MLDHKDMHGMNYFFLFVLILQISLEELIQHDE